MSRKSNETLNFERITRDYAPSHDVFSEDEHLVHRCKEALATLPPEDQKLFILYAEVGSIREVSRRLNSSPSTLHYRIERIRKTIKAKIINNQ